MFRIAALLALIAGPGGAAEWSALDGPGVRATLAGQRVVFDSGARQEFRLLGRTLYNAGAGSWGYWRVDGDLYCSMWPPSDLWACYAVAMQGTRVRFVDSNGGTTEGMVQ